MILRGAAFWEIRCGSDGYADGSIKTCGEAGRFDRKRAEIGTSLLFFCRIRKSFLAEQIMTGLRKAGGGSDQAFEAALQSNGL